MHPRRSIAAGAPPRKASYAADDPEFDTFKTETGEVGV
jgi:hypothetical protein